MNKLKKTLSCIFMAVVVLVSSVASVSALQSEVVYGDTCSGYGYTMSSSLTKTTSSASMSGSGVELYVSLSVNMYYNNGDRRSGGHSSCSYPSEGQPEDAVAEELGSSYTYVKTVGSNSFQPYDDYNVPSYGTYMEYQ